MKKEKQLFKFDKSIANEYRKNYPEHRFTYYENEKLLFIRKQGYIDVLTTKENIVKAYVDTKAHEISYGKKTDLDLKDLQKIVEDNYGHPFTIKRTQLFYLATINLNPCYQPTQAYWEKEGKAITKLTKEQKEREESMRMTPKQMRERFTI